MAEQQCPLIAIPIKLTEAVDLAGPVKTIITNSYGEDPAKYAEHLSALSRARQDAVKEGGAGNIATQRDLLYKWFHILELIELRFPELRIPFPWKDAFTKKPISQYSIAYEKASVIFNIASTLSSYAASQGRHAGNPDGLKRAYTSFRQAAGMFSYINENFLHAPSTDMSRDVIKCLVNLMLAQASEVFLEKSVEERKGNGLVAKIASHTSSMYVTLAEDMKEWVNKSIFDRLWLMLVQVKGKYFASVTQYYRALADDTKGDHGVCLVRLTLAETLAREASRLMAPLNASLLAAPVPPSTLPSDAATALTALVSTHLALCTGRKEVAIKDNDLIYHDILPSESALEAVDKFAAASPISIQDIYATPEVQKAIGQVDLFSTLVPLGVHESASMYSEEKAKLARAETERNDIANGELQAALDYMGLPAALGLYKNTDAAIADLTDPGPEVMAWAEEEARGGGARGADGLGDSPDGIDSALHQIGSFRLKASQELEASGVALDDETRECERSRVKYDHRWSQEPSGIENRELRQELKLQREALASATANDEKIELLWKQIKSDVQLLVRGRDALEQAFAEAISAVPADGSSATSSNRPQPNLLDLDDAEEDQKRVNAAEDEEKMTLQVKHLEALLAKLPKIKKERNDVLSDLKERIQTDDISHLLILNKRNTPSNGQENSLFQAELEKFKPHQQRIALSIKQQTSTLAEVTESWKELTESPLGRRSRSLHDARKRARQNLVDRLRQARDGYAEVRAAVHRGLQFYEELDTISSKLRKDTQTFVGRRRADAQKLANELEWDNKLAEPNVKPGSLAPAPSATPAVAPTPANHMPRQTVASVPEPAPVPSARSLQYASIYSPQHITSPPPPPSSTTGPPPPPAVPPTSAFASQYMGTTSSPMTSPLNPPSAYSAPPPGPQQYQTTSYPAYSQSAVQKPPSHYQSPPPPVPHSQSSYYSSGPPSSPPSSSNVPSVHSLNLAGLSLGSGTPASNSASPAPGPGLPPPPPQPFVSQYNPNPNTSAYGSGAYQPPPQPQQQQHHQPYGAPPPPAPSHSPYQAQPGYSNPLSPVSPSGPTSPPGAYGHAPPAPGGYHSYQQPPQPNYAQHQQPHSYQQQQPAPPGAGYPYSGPPPPPQPQQQQSQPQYGYGQAPPPGWPR
ncbi:bck1-like resistance to osmotic shock [Tilletia horrida]|uniref:BRO domain-containing protein 1 n=1 Tax=Tilletia horrida TaxID=155126 RepID=A0AAN6GRN6_9BASI|nr:bck1-like resistance to osmotic shock [Tilletia horrida]KAK0547519.1 bck1-like resistance to osmotic shock [Tilletia horrida]KAK0562989.1 bck1-like resistance to osmotic shock [Tilletia horrida]